MEIGPTVVSSLQAYFQRTVAIRAIEILCLQVHMHTKDHKIKKLVMEEMSYKALLKTVMVCMCASTEYILYPTNVRGPLL